MDNIAYTSFKLDPETDIAYTKTGKLHEDSYKVLHALYPEFMSFSPESGSILHRDRLGLQNVLEEIFRIFREKDGYQHVYYQPGANITLHYPCVVYMRDGNTVIHADNKNYGTNWSYRLTIIDDDPVGSFVNSEQTKTILDAISELPKCSYIRHFVNDNLNHDVFKIYYK